MFNKPVSRVVYVVLGLLLVAAIVGLAFWSTNKPAQKQTPATSQSNQSDKTKVPNNTGPSSSASVPQKSGITVAITKLQEADDKVTLEGSVQGVAAGICVAEFTTPNDKPVIRQTDALKISDTTAACGPFVIPAQQFTYLGDWQVVIKLYAEGGQASSPAKTITIH